MVHDMIHAASGHNFLYKYKVQKLHSADYALCEVKQGCVPVYRSYIAQLSKRWKILQFQRRDWRLELSVSIAQSGVVEHVV